MIITEKKLWSLSQFFFNLFFNPFTPSNFTKKCVLKLTESFFWPLCGHKELKLTKKPFTGHTVCGLLIQMQNITFWSSGMHRKQNYGCFRGDWIREMYGHLSGKFVCIPEKKIFFLTSNVEQFPTHRIWPHVFHASHI